jgi:hypothetical protein
MRCPTFDTNVEVDWQTSALQENEGCDPRWADRTAPFIFDEKGLGAVLSLQSRPWFRRLYVWQELFLASGPFSCAAIVSSLVTYFAVQCLSFIEATSTRGAS